MQSAKPEELLQQDEADGGNQEQQQPPVRADYEAVLPQRRDDEWPAADADNMLLADADSMLHDLDLALFLDAPPMEPGLAIPHGRDDLPAPVPVALPVAFSVPSIPVPASNVVPQRHDELPALPAFSVPASNVVPQRPALPTVPVPASNALLAAGAYVPSVVQPTAQGNCTRRLRYTRDETLGILLAAFTLCDQTHRQTLRSFEKFLITLGVDPRGLRGSSLRVLVDQLNAFFANSAHVSVPELHDLMIRLGLELPSNEMVKLKTWLFARRKTLVGNRRRRDARHTKSKTPRGGAFSDSSSSPSSSLPSSPSAACSAAAAAAAAAWASALSPPPQPPAAVPQSPPAAVPQSPATSDAEEMDWMPWEMAGADDTDADDNEAAE